MDEVLATGRSMAGITMRAVSQGGDLDVLRQQLCRGRVLVMQTASN